MPLPDPVPDLRSLDLLRSVGELGSIRQAARRHSISQPAASMRLRSLEHSLALQLLDRSSGRARLTTAGTAVVQWSEEILEATRELLLGTEALRTKGETHLRVVASMTVAEYLVPGWLARLRFADPSISVSLEMGNSHHVVETLLRNDGDIGFVEGNSAPRELSSRVVQCDDLVVVVAPSHPWAKRRRVLSAHELSNERLVVREEGSGTRAVLEAALGELGLSVTPLVELGSTTALKAAVAAGAAPGVVSRLTIEAELDQVRLVTVAIEGLPLRRLIRAVWPKGRDLSSPAKRLLRHVHEASNLRHA